MLAMNLGLMSLALFALLLASLLVTGHILRHAFDVRLGFGIGLAVLYTSFSLLVMTQLFAVD